MKLQTNNLCKAISSLKAVIEKSEDPTLHATLDEVTLYAIRAGVIQNFEFTYELCWKYMKRWIEENYGSTYVEGVTRRQLFRLAHENRLIDDVENWMTYHQARNITSHTYDEGRTDEVYEVAVEFAKAAELFYQRFEASNDSN